MVPEGPLGERGTTRQHPRVRPDTETFTYAGEDETVEGDFVAELAELMADGEWWTITPLRKPKEEGGVGAAPEAIKDALPDERFESVSGTRSGSGRTPLTTTRKRHEGLATGATLLLLGIGDEASSSSPMRER